MRGKASYYRVVGFRKATRGIGFLFTLMVASIIAISSAQAQTYSVLYAFQDGFDGGQPSAGVTLDRAGNLYGTTTISGGSGGGTVYKLTQRNGSWTFGLLYNVGGTGSATIGPNGSLYIAGNNENVFNLQPPAHFLPNFAGLWTATPLGPLPGPYDSCSGVVFDPNGNIYGTTLYYGLYADGTLYEISPSAGGWIETELYSFGNGADGALPYAGLLLDAAGNLYGTTSAGGAHGYGTVFELSYSAESGWTESVLYSFAGRDDGANPYGGLIFDRAGNLYGATVGADGPGSGPSTVFKLTPSDGTWTLSTLYSFDNTSGEQCGPHGTPAMDSAGNLYDTTYCLGVHSNGSVFKLVPTSGGWAYSSLHDFDGDGASPVAGVTLDAGGNIYGTTSSGGAHENGVVFEIMP